MKFCYNQNINIWERFKICKQSYVPLGDILIDRISLESKHKNLWKIQNLQKASYLSVGEAVVWKSKFEAGKGHYVAHFRCRCLLGYQMCTRLVWPAVGWFHYFGRGRANFAALAAFRRLLVRPRKKRTACKLRHLGLR